MVRIQEKFVFLLGMNNSGTTVASQVLTEYFDFYLPPTRNHEGQMLPEVRAILRQKPWNPSRQVPWKDVKNAWLKRLEDSGKSTFLEASPPNIASFTSIYNEFKNDSKFILFTSSPYLQVPSCLYNYTRPPLNEQAIKRAIDRYIRKLRYIRQIGMFHPEFPLVSYESLCRDPHEFVKDTLISDTLHDKVELKIGGKRNGKDEGLLAPHESIVDLTSRSIGFLDDDELSLMHSVLSSRESLLAHFGYSVADIQDLYPLNDKFFHEGRARRKDGHPLTLNS